MYYILTYIIDFVMYVTSLFILVSIFRSANEKMQENMFFSIFCLIATFTIYFLFREFVIKL